MSECLFIDLSPSVLDRLNPLLEPDGVLSVDERGVIDGSVSVIKPHPNFRSVYVITPDCCTPTWLPHVCHQSDSSHACCVSLLKVVSFNESCSRRNFQVYEK